MSAPSKPAEIFRNAILACRDDRWRAGYQTLAGLARQGEARGNFPGMFYGYLGVGLARCEGRKQEGLQLCRYAVKLQPKEGDNYWTLATMYMMLGRRSAAHRAMSKGLLHSPGNPRLVALEKELGVRRLPTFSFLSRSHPLNRWVGQLTWWWQNRRDEKKNEVEEIDVRSLFT